MKLALVGVGQAGGKIVDEFLRYQDRTGINCIVDTFAVNSARSDLRGLELVPEERRVLIGKEKVKGHGVGADNELGVEVMRDSLGEVEDAINDAETYKIDAFLVVAALGGGTGSGGAPVLSERLKRLYEVPVYGLGVLPSKEEGSIYTLNAARSFQTFLEKVDNLMLFDNDAWRQTTESVSEAFDDINQELVTRYSILFAAGEGGDNVGEAVVDASEIINTLASGGISSIGYASETVSEDSNGLLDRLRGKSKNNEEDVNKTNRITSLVRKSALGRLTLPCEVDGVERALLVATGPPEHISRKGIERGRKWLEEETGSMEVRGGDYPLPDEDRVGIVVVLSGVTKVPRIKQLQKVAVEAKDNIEEIRRESSEELSSLVEDDSDGLDPLF